jgi:hypothetical protein
MTRRRTNQRRTGWFGGALFLAALSGACHGSTSKSETRETISASASSKPLRAAPSASALANAAPSTTSAPPQRPAACRVLRVTGKVETTAKHEPLVTLGALDGHSWLTLAPGAEIVVRHASSAREYAIAGPALTLPCRNGAEQVLLTQGSFKSSKGTGARPGAEVWLATPFGAARYGDADLTSKVQKAAWQLDVRVGPVFVEAPMPSSGTRAGELSGPNGRAIARGKPDPRALVEACESTARRAREAAEGVVVAKASDLGSRAASQLRSRREARASCMVAEASLALLSDAEASARLGDQLRSADAEWRGVPPPGQN